MSSTHKHAATVPGLNFINHHAMADNVAFLKAQLLAQVPAGKRATVEGFVNLLVDKIAEKENLVVAKEQTIQQATARAEHVEQELLDSRGALLLQLKKLHGRGVLEALEARHGKSHAETRTAFWSRVLFNGIGGGHRRLLERLAFNHPQDADRDAYHYALGLEHQGNEADMRTLCGKYAGILHALYQRLSNEVHLNVQHTVGIPANDQDCYAIVAICVEYGVGYTIV